MRRPQNPSVPDIHFDPYDHRAAASPRIPSGRVSETLRPQPFSDPGLTRALRRASGRSHHRPPLPSPGLGDPGAANAPSARSFAEAAKHSPRPIVDVVAAFGRRPPSPRVAVDRAPEAGENQGARNPLPTSSTAEFATIRTSPVMSTREADPNAIAERVLCALLRQNDEVQANPHIPVASLRVSPHDRGIFVDLIRAKDREILKLRSSLAVSYRCAALALCRERQMRGEGLTPMEQRFVSAIANIESLSSKKSPQLLVNRAPPHVHGLPDLPIPLNLPPSVKRFYGVLSMLVADDMAQKRTGMREPRRSWQARYVVADDRGLAIFHKEEDYKQHAFQRALLVVPFHDLEFFVPSFRSLPMKDKELFASSAPAAAVDSKWNQEGERREVDERKHSGGFFASLLRNRSSSSGGGRGGSRPPKREPTPHQIHTADSHHAKIQQGEGVDCMTGADAISGNRCESARQVYHPQWQETHDRYDEFMARVAIEFADDLSFAYFGFVPKQPNTQLASRVTNPPIVFRTQSAEVHAEWAHRLAQFFNRKLYCEMFPSVLAESYIGTFSKETQTCEEPESATMEDSQTTENSAEETQPDGVRVNCARLPFLRAAETVAPVPPRAHIALQTSPRASRAASTLTEHTAHTEPPQCREAPGEAVPWAELVSELRELLAAKNTEREALLRESAAWREEAQRAGAARDEALARHAQITKECEEMAREGNSALEAAKAREVSSKREADALRAERDLLAAELRATRDGYGEGLRAMARRALGDIDCLHDAYTAEEYLRGLRHRGDEDNEKEEESEGETKGEGEGTPMAPPPPASLRANHLEGYVSELSGESEDIGVAMLLVSFSPQSRVIDGCFTVDERHARLLRSEPSDTRLGRQWFIYHHDTGAVLAVRTELQAEKSVTRAAPSPMRRSSARREREVERKRKMLIRK